MSLTLRSAVLDGTLALPITLEFSATHHGLPNITFVGMPRSSVLESRERVLASFRSLKIALPRAKVTINMQPVDMPKQGSSLDLPIALGLLMLHGIVPAQPQCAAVGELGLSGQIRSFPGISCLLESLVSTNRRVFTSADESKVLSLVSSPQKIFPALSLQDLIDDLQGKLCLLSQSYRKPYMYEPTVSEHKVLENERISASLAQVLSVSLVGGNHLLIYGSPGVGKSYVKTLLPSILPPLEEAQARAHLRYQQLLGTRDMSINRVILPHTSATIAGILGGGIPFRPGALQQAHQGVLFLDEIPEFRSEVLESLRQPLEDEGVVLVRSGRSYFIPSACTVIATANPCPCGYFGDKQKCHCSVMRVRQYMERLSGPLLDRFALQYRLVPDEEKTVSLFDLANSIASAREFQKFREKEFGVPEWARLYTQDDCVALGCWEGVRGFEDLSVRRKLHICRIARCLADMRLAKNLSATDWEKAYFLGTQTWGLG